MYCPNTSDPKIKEDFDRYAELLGSNKVAGLLYHKNNGNFLDKTPTGEDSLMFRQLLAITNNLSAAIRIKAQFYSDQYLEVNNWLDSGIEPIEEVSYIKGDIDIQNMYVQNNLETLYSLERLPSGKSTYVNYTPSNNKSQTFKVNNRFIKPAVTTTNGENHYIAEIDDNTKKFIVDRFFRLGENRLPHYPFSLGNTKSNLKYIDIINSEFKYGVKVVKYNKDHDTIEFTDNTIGAQYEVNESTEARDYRNQDDISGMNEPTELSKKLDPDKEMISRYEGLIDVINKSLSEKTGRRDALLARRDRLMEKIEQLKIDGSNKIIIQQAKDDVDVINTRLLDIRANLHKDLNEEQLWSVMADLQELGAYIRGWHGLSEMLNAYDIPLKEIRDEVISTSGELDVLHNEYMRSIKNAMVKYANKTSFKADFSDKLFDALEDDTLLNRMVFGAHMSNSDLVKVVNDIIEKAAYKINEEIRDKDRELNNWIKKLQKHTGISDTAKISERFHQLDKNGKWTGGIVSKIKQDYWDEIHSLTEKASTTGKWAPYFAFLAANTHEMQREEFEAYMSQKASGLPFDIKKISKQKHSNGEYVWKEKDFIRQEELINKYNSRREAYKSDVLASGKFTDANGEFIHDDLMDQFMSIMNAWDLKNNPWQKVPGHNRNPFAKYRVRDAVDSRWFDSRFAAIEKDPLMKEFYDFYRERMLDNDNSLPFYKKTQSNLIFSVRKTMAEEIASHSGTAKIAAMMKDGAMNLIMAESQSDIEGRAIVGGKIYKNIPVGMLYTSLTGNERSPDIFKALKKHTDVAINYKYKNEVEPIANAAQDIIDDMAGVKSVDAETGKTLSKNKHTGLAHQEKGALFNTRARLQYLVDAKLYGESQSKPDLHGNGIKSSTGKTMKFSGTKLVDSLIKFKYLQALSIPNIISPTVNLAVGTVNNYSYAAGGIDFDDKSLTLAYPKIIAAISKHIGKATHSKNFEQIMTWLVNLDILPEINSAAFEDSASWDKMLTILQSKGEYINQGAVMIAYLTHNKLKDKNNNDVSIIDAFNIKNGHLIWNTELMGEKQNAGEHEIISADGHGINMFRLSQKIKGINEFIHGDYVSKQEIKKTAAGRAVALFKTWVFSTTEHRFGSERFDTRLQRDVKGRYRSFFQANTLDGVDLTIKKIIPLLLKALVSKKALDVLSEVDKVNLKRNLRELQILGTLTILGMIAMGASDDEDDENTLRALNTLINLMTKTQSDLEFYLNPASMASIADNVVPILGTVNDMRKIVTTFYGTVIGDGIYVTGPFKGQSKLKIAVGRAFPMTNGAVKMWNYSQQQFNFGSSR